MYVENKKILVVLPTYNNSGTLLQVLNEVVQHSDHILIVNDGSTDKTSKILKDIESSKVKVISHDVNRGKGAAIASAFDYASRQSFDFLITMDTDGQHMARDIPRFTKKINEAVTRAILIGDRALDRSDSPDIPSSSKFGRKFSDFWVWIETGKKITDTQSGFRAYPVRDISLSHLKTKSYDFEIEVLVKSVWKGIAIDSVPIHIFYPPRDERVSHFSPLKDNFRLSLLHTKLVALRILNFFKFKQAGFQSGEKGGSSLLRICLQYGGTRFCYFFAPIVVFFYFLFSRKARSGIEALYRHLGITNKIKLWFLSFQNFHFFAISMIDRMALSFNRYKFDWVWDSPPIELKETSGALLIGSHLGDWFFCGIKLKERLSKPLFLISDRRFSKNFHTQMGESIFKDLKLIDVSQDGLQVLLQIKEAFDQEGVICFLGDRLPAGKESPSVKTHKFLGEEALFPVSHFELAIRLRKPVYAFTSLKWRAKSNDPFHCDAFQLWDAKTEATVEDLLKSYVEFLEMMVRRAPQSWYNFFDFWKNK